MRTDIIIVGQGLAGSLLAWELLERGRRVLVIDRDEAVTSSKIAAGIVTPITGKRLAPSWRIDETLDFAMDFYRQVEKRTGGSLFHPTPIARLLDDELEAERWKKKVRENGGQLPSHAGKLTIDETVFRAEHGGFEMQGSGWLDVAGFLEATRQHLLERASYAIADLHAEEISFSKQGLRWKNVEADRIVFCQGWEGNRNRFFDWLEFRQAKGQILDLEFDREPSTAEDRIINRKGWLLRTGAEKFRAGSTYEWDFPDADASRPTDDGRAEIEAKVKAMFHQLPGFQVTRHQAAVRPIIRESRAVIGVHPSSEWNGRIAFFNGLGSKGVLNGPLFAGQLAAHLAEGGEIDEEADLRRNL